MHLGKLPQLIATDREPTVATDKPPRQECKRYMLMASTVGVPGEWPEHAEAENVIPSVECLSVRKDKATNKKLGPLYIYIVSPGYYPWLCYHLITVCGC